MAHERTEQLIVELARDAAPVTRLPPMVVRLARWIAMALAAAAAGVWLIGAREDLWPALTTPSVFASVALTLVAAATAGAAALRLSVPGADQARYSRWVPIAATASWVAVLWTLSREAGVSTEALLREPFHLACGARVVALSLLPSLALVSGVRRGFALDRVWAAVLAVLAGSALAAGSVQLVCPIDRPAHLLVAHALPMLLLAALGGLAASRWIAASATRATRQAA